MAGHPEEFRRHALEVMDQNGHFSYSSDSLFLNIVLPSLTGEAWPAREKKKLGNRKPGLSSEQTVSATCNLGGNKSELKAGVQNSTLPAASPRPYLGKGYAVFSTEISQQE